MTGEPFIPLKANDIDNNALEDDFRSSDLTQRIRSLFLKYDRANWSKRSPSGSWIADDRNATTEDWQRLAIALAFQHHEEGFTTYFRQVAPKSPREDLQIERDELMLQILEEKRCRITGKEFPLRDASKLAAAELLKRDKARKAAFLKAGGDEIDFVPNQIDSESIRTQFASRREKARTLGRDYEPALPSHLRIITAGAAIFGRMLAAAKIVTEQPALRRKTVD